MDSYLERILTTLGERDPIQVLQATPRRLQEYLEAFPEEHLERSYAPGKWSVREILAHLADIELAMGFRLRQGLAEENVTLRVLDQDRWAACYSRLEPTLAVEAFRGLRAWNLALLATFSLDDWLKEVFHPERGPESLDLMVRFLAGHDLNHLAQLEAIAAGL